MSSMNNVVSLIKSALNGADTPGKPLYTLSNAMVNYLNGELFGTAQLTANDEALVTNGVSIYILTASSSGQIYCGGMVGPAEGGTLQLQLPMSFGTSSSEITFTSPTQVRLVMIVVYDGNNTFQTSQDFTVHP